MKNKALAIGLILISLTQTQTNTAKAQSWEEYEGKWYYKQDDGEYAKNTWIDGYYINQEGTMQTNAWTPDGYYVGEDGKWEENIKTGWNKNQNGKWTYIDPETKSIIKNSWIGNYYVGENGIMQTNAWTPDGYYVDENGQWEANKQTGWQQEGNNYYYIKENGEKITNEIIELGGSLFCFDENGKMKEEEWIKIPNNKWAYAKKGGYLAREEWIGNYYIGKNGITLKNTWTPDGYYVGERGEWEANKKQGWNTTTEGKYYYIDAKGDKVKNGIKEIEGNLFYFDEEGTLLENQWKKIDQTHWIYAKEGGYLARNEWLGNYYVGENGATLTNTWSKDGYYLGETGEIQYPEWKQNETGYWYKNEDGSYPKSEWKEIAEKWYHFDENGYMQTGWQYINNKWYYLTDSGAMAKDTWIGGIYYLDSNGAMLTNTWTPDGYYVDENGVYAPDKAKEEGWYQINGNYYYGENGKIVKNRWVGNYYLGEDGQMLTNTTTPDGYYVGSDGAWVNNYSEGKFSHAGKKLADISEHNGYIDFSKLKNEVDGVIIRVGFGTVREDVRWREYADNALREGIPFGFYWYSYALNEQNAIDEANMFLNAISGYKPEYPIFIDMEDADYWKQNQGSQYMANTWSGREKIIKIHVEEYQRRGYFAGVYASRSWFDSMSSDLDKYTRWVAHWTGDSSSYQGSGYGIHQYTSNGSVGGISTRVDLNVSFIDYPSIIKNSGYNNWR